MPVAHISGCYHRSALHQCDRRVRTVPLAGEEVALDGQPADLCPRRGDVTQTRPGKAGDQARGG